MEQLEDEYAIGLDLGTTFSCIGVYRNGWVEIIPNRIGEKITPSVVIISNDGKILVGEETTDFLVQNYDSCIYEVKRLIGRDINEEELEKLQKKFPFKIIRPNLKNCKKGKIFPEIEITKNNQTMTYTPVKISSLIIQKMVSNAEKYLNKKITKLVLTVPANFQDAQRKLTEQAAEILGIKVLRIINEPTAAALAYGFREKRDHHSYILIFDLGGGTFDVSILSLEKDKKNDSTSFNVLGTCGDTNLGGEDFDEVLVELLLENMDTTIANKIRRNKMAMKRLKVSCENYKKILSVSESVNIFINNIIENVDIIDIINREDFLNACQPLFDRLIEPISKALDLAKEKDINVKIDEIILVGGSTRIPKIKEIIRDLFPNTKINDSINPDEAVAYGATLEAEKILHNKDSAMQNFSLLDIIPFSLGTDVINKDANPEIQKEGELMAIIIKRGERIPTFNLKTYSTVYDNQESMSINIYEGEKKFTKYNHLLKKCTINGLTKRPKGQTKVVMKFDIDTNGILNVEAKEESFDGKGQVVNLVIKNDEVNLSNEEMENLKQKMKDLINKFGNKNDENNLDYINIKGILKKYRDAFEKCKNDKKYGERYKIIYIKNYYTTLEKFIDKLDQKFDNETVLFKFYLYVKDLFQSYIEAFELDLDKGDRDHIIQKIYDYIKKFINETSGYLNGLIEILSPMKNKKYKVEFLKLIVFVIQNLNKLGRETIVSNKIFCKYHSLLYFEQSNFYYEKYFPKKIETEENGEQNVEREFIDLLPPEDIQIIEKESKSCLDYIRNIKNGAILLCEESLKKGKLINQELIELSDSGTGYTSQQAKLNLDQMNRKNQEIYLDNYEKLLSEIQISSEFTKEEAICIANIIKIYSCNKVMFQNKSRYLLYLARRCETIAEHLQITNENWYKECNGIYKELNEYKPDEKEYKEILKEIKEKYPK